MAKSRLEPNKIVRYAESNIPKNGIGTRPAPTVKPSPAAAKAAVQAVVEAPAPPAPTPPAPTPPAPEGETRSFLFDGATELTASYSTAGGAKISRTSIGGTFRPAWGAEETGSFAIFSVTDDRVADGYNMSYFFERTSGSTGYHDYIGGQFSSGSGADKVYFRSRKELSHSPNFHSGSVTNRFIQVVLASGLIQDVYENGKKTTTPFTYSASNPSDAAVLAARQLDNTNYSMSVGGPASGSSYFSGSIANLYVTKSQRLQAFKSMPTAVENYAVVDFMYKFEGNVSASKGPRDLEVVGNELYVSSSL